MHAFKHALDFTSMWRGEANVAEEINCRRTSKS